MSNATPSYDVDIRRNSDGIVRRYHNEYGWHESADFWWADGNGRCDCNRSLFFARAGGDPEPEHPECGVTAYTILKYYFPDGTTKAGDE